MLAFRLNVAAWLERLGPALFGVTSLGAVAIYALRRQRGPVEWGWGGLTVAMLLAAVVILWLVRRRFFSGAEARVLIESQLRLDTRLTAASAGLVPWPTVPEKLPTVVQWQLRVPVAWFSSAVLLLLLAAYVPVPELSVINRAGEKPPALGQAEAMLAALAEAKVADAAAVEQIAERARELANRPAEQQYSHSALEAADALRDQTAAAVSALSRNLEAAANALAENEPSSQAAAGRLSAALTGLREGSLPANAELLKQLAADATALDKLSPEQLKALGEALAEASQRAKGVLGATGTGAPVARPGTEGGDASSFGGPGGKGGGESSAPLALANQASDAGDGKSEALSAASLANLALGDKLGTTTGAHEVDPSKAARPTSAGAIAAPAKGGEAVWVNRLTPAERAALKDFYK